MTDPAPGGTKFDVARLRRRPDVEAPNLQAWDAADLLLLDTAAADLSAAALATNPGQPGVAVIGDSYGALTLGAAARHGLRGLRVHQDPLSGEQALDANAADLGLPGVYTHHPLAAPLVDGARVVLLRLPRSLAALEAIAALIAGHAAPDVAVYAGGRVKHMTTAMNDVLARYFGTVTAGLGRQKSRVLTASAPLPRDRRPADRFPVSQRHDVGLARPLELQAYGAAFGGAALDPGTRFLLPHLASARAVDHAVDLGCGTGAIAAYLALTRPGLRVLATDQSAAAAASAARTLEANGVADRAVVTRADALGPLPDSSEQLIVLNPPFHIGAAVYAGIALKLFADAGRVLEPGGELWTVWNSHLMYKPALTRLVGPTREVARNPKFTVTVSTRR
ncbi:MULTISPECIES: methyltransferase [unclassified Arthrobacter]|uniref:class I SAM-dependent methyltransferase n=1 Tax=unclassified Arthrobacter TaxID=235627 RepID=UPI0024DFA418|nr:MULTISPECIES: methyltransferase [unclassified Arthrobacter]MCC9145342.1 methyltransferase [Arthrobacter sp. zg-Y919]MDK1276570.1 methyltransferase [Arthrobacter sp. zg.Y919]WIB01841.1 methyltransferase [Arthrobacter sp. zg-Y919]